MATLIKAWIVLVAMTLIAMWVGAVHDSPVPIMAQVAIVLVIAGIKASTILRYFLGLSSASRSWRVLFSLYLILLCGAIFAIYTAGSVMASHTLTLPGS
ncbi:MAG TPA: cytochrome C oxidase subunit IV family protein [Hyphomicrobium sp.]|nr:cytochrome C oxidase subunit IV family protein [Hyphomicrobium sp.]